MSVCLSSPTSSANPAVREVPVKHPKPGCTPSVRPAAERFKSASTERRSDASLACEYAVVDVETANPARRSICQIGLVIMRGTQEIAAHSWFVDHQGPMTLTWIHGITEEMLDGAPTFAELYPGLLQIIAGRPIVSHSQFDPQAFRAATAHNDLPEIEGPWIDSMDMVRHVKDMPRPQSSGLADICEAYGIPLQHHDALSDARAAARITAMAIQSAGLEISHFI